MVKKSTCFRSRSSEPLWFLTKNNLIRIRKERRQIDNTTLKKLNFTSSKSQFKTRGQKLSYELF